MTKEEKKHYYLGGKFKATYKPILSDTRDFHKSGMSIIVHQNCLITPIGEDEYNRDWAGQLRFNSKDIYGWFPEEDIIDLKIINDFIEYPEQTKRWNYKLTYTEQSQVFGNFGKGNFIAPMSVYRDYTSQMDDYLLKLSKPQATKIEKQFIDLLEDEFSDWEIIFNQKKESCL